MEFFSYVSTGYSSSALSSFKLYPSIYVQMMKILFPFQALIIMACHDVGSPLQMFNANIFEDVMSIFITSAIIKLIKGY